MRCLSRLVVLLACALLRAAIHTKAEAGESVTYTVAGNEYEGYYSKAAGTSKGLVIVIHDWDGLTDYEEKARQHAFGDGLRLS